MIEDVLTSNSNYAGPILFRSGHCSPLTRPLRQATFSNQGPLATDQWQIRRHAALLGLPFVVCIRKDDLAIHYSLTANHLEIVHVPRGVAMAHSERQIIQQNSEPGDKRHLAAMRLEKIRAAAIEHLRSGQLLKAQSCVKEAFKLDAESAESLHLMAVVDAAAGRADRAIDWASRAIRKDPQPVYLPRWAMRLRVLAALKRP